MARAVDLLIPAISRLAAAGVPDAARDARRLLAHATGVGPDRLALILPEEIDTAKADAFEALIGRRVRREPVSHIVGVRAFYGREFLVTPDVLDPRPETETLIEVALAEPFTDVLDLGTGSGCILLTLLAERCGLDFGGSGGGRRAKHDKAGDGDTSGARVVGRRHGERLFCVLLVP